ncbi:hypothetical protein NHF48_005930 [Sphingomonas sp. H160509]|uniref:hypothetical protein n=1 Tax=Sphingomonas sp. H160509 TaxID=2955313 RepID=UPI0020974D86|nr:hypothetical protein [Sphingomonas sp. H160509]MDD1450624.1 hypothetical protein [Sphingomonas sp. H160509]
MLRAEQDCALATGRCTEFRDERGGVGLGRKRDRGDGYSEPLGGDIEDAADRAPVMEQRSHRPGRTSTTLRTGEHFECVTFADQRRLALRLAWGRG